MIRRIVYSSLACETLVVKDVYDIIRQSHNRNSKNGLTGGLLFIDRYFYQLLEGLPTAVEARYQRIAQDPRHTELVVRQDVTTEAPLFASDWMALRDGGQIDPGVLESHGYRLGMPAEEFSGEQILAFLLDCFGKPTSPATSTLAPAASEGNDGDLALTL